MTDAGQGLLTVLRGWVSLERDGRSLAQFLAIWAIDDLWKHAKAHPECVRAEPEPAA